VTVELLLFSFCFLPFKTRKKPSLAELGSRGKWFAVAGRVRRYRPVDPSEWDEQYAGKTVVEFAEAAFVEELNFLKVCSVHRSLHAISIHRSRSQKVCPFFNMYESEMDGLSTRSSKHLR
jgi:hypothetical protein